MFQINKKYVFKLLTYQSGHTMTNEKKVFFVTKKHSFQKFQLFIKDLQQKLTLKIDGEKEITLNRHRRFSKLNFQEKVTQL